LFIPAYNAKPPRLSQIPQPEGWGLFIPAYVIQPTFLTRANGVARVVG